MYVSCLNSDNGEEDNQGNRCEDYNYDWCGLYDTANFKSDEMCCVCGGGSKLANNDNVKGNRLLDVLFKDLATDKCN